VREKGSFMNNEFKWLCNPTKKHFIFQFDSVEYEVPAQSRKLFPAVVASHGLKASYGLTDPEFDRDGNVVKAGNDVYCRCRLEDADVMNPIGYSEPVILERSRDTARDVVSLSVDPEKPIKKYIKKTKKVEEEPEKVMEE